jgi:hypothetical protein
MFSFPSPQYILRKAFDCSPDGKVLVFAAPTETCIYDRLVAISSPVHFMATEGAILRRRWIFMDRRVLAVHYYAWWIADWQLHLESKITLLRSSQTRTLLSGMNGGQKRLPIPRKHTSFGTYSTVRGLDPTLLLFMTYPLAGHFPSKAAVETAVRYDLFFNVDQTIAQHLNCSWIPRGDWGCASDPSGRSVTIHNAAY